MAARHDIIHIDFQANAGRANVAIKSIQEEADKSARRVKELKDQLAALPKDAPASRFQELNQQLKTAEANSKAWKKAVQQLAKGVTALDEAIKLFNKGKGSTDSMNVALATAARNAALLQQKRSDTGSKTWKEMDALVHALDQTITKGKTDLDGLIATIEKGGTISKAVLGQAEKDLMTLRDLEMAGSKEWQNYDAQLQKVMGHVTQLRKQELTTGSSILGAKDLGKYSENDIRQAIASAKELMTLYGSASSEAQELAQNIVRAEEHLKTYGVEAARVAAREKEQLQQERELATTMNKRLKDLKSLSADALVETRKYWEAQKNGAAEGTKEFMKAENALKQIDNLQKRRTVDNLSNVLGNPSKYGVAEVRSAISEMEKLRDSVQKGIPVWNKYNKLVEQGKAYIDTLAKSEAAQRIAKQMQNISTLSASGLQEVKRYWETMVAGATRGSGELDEYRSKLEQVKAEEKNRAKETALNRVGVLQSGSLGQYSESEIRQAIEAGNQLIKTYKTGNTEAEMLARQIVNAEEHLRQYGVEAQRTAQRQANDEAKAKKALQERIELMARHFNANQATMSESALKANERFWQQLIDDPKTASESLEQYRRNLELVQRVIQARAQMKTTSEGEAALQFFRTGRDENASADEVKKQADALKKYRDSLPQKDNEQTIIEINNLRTKAGQAAQKAAEQTMTLKEALQMGGAAAQGNFKGTTDQLKQAKKTLEEMQQQAAKGGYAWRRMQEGIEAINKELKETSFISKNVQAVLDQPKGKSYNELKQAVEQGRLALQNMRTTTSEEKKAFDDLAAKIKQADFAMKELGNSAKGTANAFDKAWSRLKTYIGLYVGAAVAMQKISATMGDLMELSDKMGEVRKTTGFTADQVGRLSDNLRKMDTRTTITGLLDLSVAAGQLGLKTEEDVQGFTEAANKLMVALPEMGREGATEMLKVALATGEIDKIRKQMEQGLIDGSSATAVAMEKVGSTIDRLRATSAATAPAITDFVKRVGAVGAQSGISIDQVAALGSTVDALGMRVEMSATALSRMIPAIRNNAFDVAKAIGVTPDTLRNLFDTGRGMEAILMIFQHIKDAGMGEDDIEKMLGMGNMKEVMKELNQQGARAGIVFSGLSQNVDELRRQLGVASQAYEENIAIQQEYDKMNETTMAKWQRLKNQLEETVVSDYWQQKLGALVDTLRWIVDFITGNMTPAVNVLSDVVKALILAVTTSKLGVGGVLQFIFMWIVNIRANVVKLTEAFKAFYAAHKANVWMAIGMAVYYLINKIHEARTAVSELDQALNKLEEDEENEERTLSRLVSSFTASNKTIAEATKKYEEAKVKTEALRKEVGEMKKANDLSASATEVLSKKVNELNESEVELKKASDEMNKANGTRLNLIKEINERYSSYLGYMLSEKTAAEQVASAHQLIIDKLKEEMQQKRMLRNQEAIEKEFEEDINEWRQDARVELNTGNLEGRRDIQQRVMERWSGVTSKIAYDSNTGKYTIPVIEGVNSRVIQGTSAEGLRKTLKTMLSSTMTQVAKEMGISREWYFGKAGSQFDRANLAWGGYGTFDTDGFGKFTEAQLLREQRVQEQRAIDEAGVRGAQEKTRQDAVKDIQSNQKALNRIVKENKELTDDNIRMLAQHANAITANLEKYGDAVSDIGKYVDKDGRVSLANTVNTLLPSLDEATRKRVLATAQRQGKVGAAGTGTGGASTTTTTPWGGNASADSTDYGTWDVNELVARRQQMDKFKNILKPDTDIRAVLAEDKALMKALDNGLKEDWKSVMAWYNQERLKIQQELKGERYSTYMGHWRDEKNGRGRRNRLIESDYALAELDRYYSRRKEALEKARIEENMSEETFNRQNELLEQEHLERRSKLRQTFTAGNTKAEQEMVKQFREWWATLAQRGELDQVPWNVVESEWSKALAAQIGRNNLRAQQDLTKIQEITVKHLNAIAKLIDKERPYDGITANLRKNLNDMDILTADLAKNGPTEDTAKLVKTETERLKFLLSESESAYTLTFEQLKEHMIQKGFGEWAAAIENDEQMKQSMMQQLRNTYDAIQEAIKKESSVIKKQLEVQWNDMLPGATMSMKGTFEKAASDLGLMGDRVSRASNMIGAGPASERVVDKLAVQQLRVQLQMQETYFALMRKIGDESVRQLKLSAAAFDAEAKAAKKEAEALKKEGKLEEATLATLKAQDAERKALQNSFDAEHAQKSLNLAKTKEVVEEEKLRVAIANQLEESQARLYRELKEWANLLSSSLQNVFEASHAGDASYYNELAKLNLTGKGGPGAGTYIVIDNEGTADATAHYEYLDERAALERQREIENENAVAEAWKKAMDDINMRMNDTITDYMNAMLQNQAIDANTQATLANTDALWALATVLGAGGDYKRNADGFAVDNEGNVLSPVQPTEKQPEGFTSVFEEMSGEGAERVQENIRNTAAVYTEAVIVSQQEINDAVAEMPNTVQLPTGLTDEQVEKNVAGIWAINEAHRDSTIETQQEISDALAEMPNAVKPIVGLTDEQIEDSLEKNQRLNEGIAEASKESTDSIMQDQKAEVKGQIQTDKQKETSAQMAFAKMTSAANLYGVAYQAVANENLSTSQKVQMIAVQAAGQAAMTSLTTNLTEEQGKQMVRMPGILGKLLGEMPYPAAMATYAAVTALMGALMAMATSAVTKSKTQIAQVTGASVNAGRLSTGMLTYAEGNVNEFTDPASLQVGRQYNVDAADGKTYRARYMGNNPRTHLTNGPEFHLSGERGREMIIDAGTTRQITMNDGEIWHAIQTLSGGGRLRHAPRRQGMRTFAEGNVEDFEEMADGSWQSAEGAMGAEQMAQFQTSLDRNNELLERALTEGIHAHFDVYGRGGLIDSYDTGKKTVQSHGERY